VLSRTRTRPLRDLPAAIAALFLLLVSGTIGPFSFGTALAARSSSSTPAHEHVSLDSLRALQIGDFPDFNFVHDVVTPQPQVFALTNKVSQDSLAAYIQHLEDYGTRYVSSPQIKEAEHWLGDKLRAFGYSDVGLTSIAPDGKVQLASANVVATKTGLTVPEYRVVVCGHYDSIVSSDQGSPLDSAPGADDNASGSAATLEIARLLSDYELDATVQFVLFTAEETGLYGSRQMAAEFVSDGVRPEDVFVLNMDMIANMDITPWEMIIYDDPLSRPLALLAARITQAYTSLLPVMAGTSSRSDHYPFQQAGYPAIFFHEAGGHPYYHTVNDRLIYLEMDYAAEVVKTVLATTLHMAQIADPPGGVHVSQTVSGELMVKWSHSTDADVLGYHVELIDAGDNLLWEQFTADNFLALDPTEAQDGRWVRVRAEDVLGVSEPSEPALLSSGEFLALGVTPNPTAGKVSLDLFIPGAGEEPRTTVRVFDAAGRLIATVYDDPLPRGSNHLQWEDTSAPSGIYFYSVDVEGLGRKRGKIMLVR
jgi:hypothetical protein